MKKIMALVMALLVAASLCSCAVLDNFGVKIEPMETPADVVVLPEDAGDAPAQPDEGPEELPTPEVSDTVFGNLPANIAAGGHVAMSDDGRLFWAHATGLSYGAEETGAETGVYARVGDGYEKISGDNAMDLNVLGDRLYYIAQTWNGDEGTAEIVSMNFDGSDRKVIAEAAPIKWESRRSDDDDHAEYTHFVGYADLIAYDGQLYFIGDNGKSNGRDIHSAYMEKTYNTVWHNEKSLYRMEPDGSNKTVIVESLGNGMPHFTIGEDGKIFYSTCYDAGATVYPHITLNVCNADGSNAQLLYGTTDTVADDAKREIINGMFYAEGFLFVSASDSEGDFPHGRLMAYKDGQYELWGDETYHVNYAYDGAGGLYNLFSPTDYVLYDEANGMEYIEDAQLLRTALDHIASGAAAGESKVLHEFGTVERWGEEFSRFELAAFDGGRLLTLLTEEGLYTLDLENGGGLEKIVK